jgi:hypothetical protein
VIFQCGDDFLRRKAPRAQKICRTKDSASLIGSDFLAGIVDLALYSCNPQYVYVCKLITQEAGESHVTVTKVGSWSAKLSLDARVSDLTIASGDSRFCRR